MGGGAVGWWSGYMSAVFARIAAARAEIAASSLTIYRHLQCAVPRKTA